MSTEEVSASPRRAGAHAQERADALRSRLIVICLVSLAIIAVSFVALGGRGRILVLIELAAPAGMLLAGRWIEPAADRWSRGAQGERTVGAILEGLGPGWHVLHDVCLGKGNIDHVLVGPGGTFTIETKANRGRIDIDAVDAAMTRQAYAERKALERVTGLEVEALLVFSEAWIAGSVPARRRGVVVLPARMLSDFLTRRPPALDGTEVTVIAERLRIALERSSF